MNKKSFSEKIKDLEYIDTIFTCPNCSSKLLEVVEKESIDKGFFKNDNSIQKCIVECQECKQKFASKY